MSRIPDFNRFVDNKPHFPALASNDRCVLNRLRNSTHNAISRGLLGSAVKSQASSPVTVHSSRKRITFGDDTPSNSQPAATGGTYLGGPSAAFQSLLFDSNNNNNSSSSHNQPASGRGGNGTGATSFAAKEEHDSPRNGVRKDVKLISDAAETEELFGRSLDALAPPPPLPYSMLDSMFSTRALDCGRVVVMVASQSEFLLSVSAATSEMERWRLSIPTLYIHRRCL